MGEVDQVSDYQRLINEERRGVDYGKDTTTLLWRVLISRFSGELNVRGLQIDFLPELPRNLKNLDCSHTNIVELPELPTSLQQLFCSHTKIKNLPKLPENLKVLHCRNTYIQKVSELPKSIDALEWSYYNYPMNVNTFENVDCSLTNLSKLTEVPTIYIDLPQQIFIVAYNCSNTSKDTDRSTSTNTRITQENIHKDTADYVPPNETSSILDDVNTPFINTKINI